MQYLSILALGADRPGLVAELSELVARHECSIKVGRMIKLQADMAISMLVTGSWNGIAKIEAGLPLLEQKYALNLITKRTDEQNSDHKSLPYMAQMMGLDQPNVVHQITSFLTKQGIPIYDLNATTTKAQHTDANIFNLVIHLGIPSEVVITELREQLMVLCDDLNIDGILEPERR